MALCQDKANRLKALSQNRPKPLAMTGRPDSSPTQDTNHQLKELSHDTSNGL